MRRTTKPIVRLARPVLRVMSRFKSRQAEVGDLVVLVTGGTHFVDHHSVHFGGKIFVWFWAHTACNLIRKWSAFVYLQQIKRQMCWSQLQSFIEISFPASERLSRQSRN